jgi:hypothetical protein
MTSSDMTGNFLSKRLMNFAFLGAEVSLALKAPNLPAVLVYSVFIPKDVQLITITAGATSPGSSILADLPTGDSLVLTSGVESSPMTVVKSGVMTLTVTVRGVAIRRTSSSLALDRKIEVLSFDWDPTELSIVSHH